MKACEAYIDLIMRAVDGEAAQQEEAALHAHLEHCEGCRRLYETYRAVDRSIRNTEEEPPEQLTAAIMNGIRAEKAQPKQWFRRYRFTMIAAAAAVVILVSTKIGGNYAKQSVNTTEDTTAAAAAEVPEMAAEFRSGTDMNTAEAGAAEGAMEDMAEPAEVPAPAVVAEAEETTGEGAPALADQYFSASEETIDQTGADDGFDAVRIERLEKAGYYGEALLVSGIDQAELELLLPEITPITLDDGEIVYEVGKSSVDDLIEQGKLHVAARHGAEEEDGKAVYWIILES